MLDQAPKIPNYDIISPLGSGTSGQVWLAKDKYGERRAIKVTHIGYINSVDYQRRFRREVRAQQQLYEVSSHVPRIFDYDEKHIPPYIVMDYINGMDLNRLIASGEIHKYDLQTRLHWIEALASTLTKAHAIRIPGDTHGIIHRDIKPQNIRLQGGRAYLLDFSISLTSDVAVDSTQDAMTLRYVAPEVTASEASDIFSFGLVAFEILFEIHPISTYDEASKIVMSEYIDYAKNKLEMGTWRLPSTTEAKFTPLSLKGNRKQLDTVFQKILSVDPKHRFKTPKDFSDALISILLGSPTSQAFQSYSAKSTTESPQVTVQFDDSSVDDNLNEQELEIPHDTRRFTKEELELPIEQELEIPDDTRRFTQKELELPIESLSRKEQIETPSLDTVDDVSSQVSNSSDSVGALIKPKQKPPQHSQVPVSTIAIFLGLIAIIVLIALSNNQSVVPIFTDTPLANDSQAEVIAPISETAVGSSALITTNTATLTRTPTVTHTSTPTQTNTATLTLTATHTSTPTMTSTFTLTPTPTHTLTVTPSQTPTITYTPSATSQAWQIEQRILTVADTNVVIPVIYMPEGCVESIDGKDICLEQGVWIDLEPISNEKYDLCLRGATCSRPAFGEQYDSAGAGATNPVVGVNLAMAQSYCDWRDAQLPDAQEWQVLMIAVPEAYHDIDEWIFDVNAPGGQSQVYNIVDDEMRGVWLEDSYLGDDLSFRCVQFE